MDHLHKELLQRATFTKLNTDSPCDSAILLCAPRPRDMKAQVHTKACTRISSIPHCQKLETDQMPVSSRTDRQIMVHFIQWKTAWQSNGINYTDSSQERYAEQREPDTKTTGSTAHLYTILEGPVEAVVTESRPWLWG